MKIREVLQRIHSAYSKGVQSDDSRLSNRYIYNKLLTTRAFLLSREVNKKKKLSHWNYYTLSCIEIQELLPNEDCPCLPAKGCTIFRSVHPIPKILADLSQHMIKSVVSSLNRETKFSETSVNQTNYRRGGKYTSNTNKYFIHNGYLYIESNKNPIAVSMTFIPEDFVEAFKFKSYCPGDESDSCVSLLDKDFIIDSYLIEPMIQMAYEEVVAGFSASRADIANDNLDGAASNVRGNNLQQQEPNE